MSYPINFLPPSYRQRQARQRRLFMETLILVGAAGAAALIFVGSLGTLWRLSSQAEKLERRAHVATQSADELAQLQAREQILQKQLVIQRELLQPVTYTQILRAMTEVAPESITLVDLAITTRRHAPKPYQGPATAATAQAKRQAKSATTAAAVSEPEVLGIVLTGLAASDDDVADFFESINDHPAFSNVKMQFVRPVEFANVSGREFRLKMQVPLDREYRPVAQRPGQTNKRQVRDQESDDPKGVAHAH